MRSLITELAVGNLPAPGPASVVAPILTLFTTTMFPGPLADARELPIGTIVGETNTASVPSGFLFAVPTSLIVQRRILAYSKSTAEMDDIPVVGTVAKGTVLPKANLAKRAIFACTSYPSTSAAGSASAKPSLCASCRAFPYSAPSSSILHSMKLVVPFMMPITLVISSARKSVCSEWMMGMPPQTAASKLNLAEGFWARASCISGR
mmetsp:Transcript_6400/g.14151  ORF Transcript_6400/g.14151 Transcript_6400/m.14151 type:complete len:207 (-) Transcript_6400:368-988(-)